MKLSELKLMEGSPPRVRGKGEWVQAPVQELGITPARAGKSQAGRCGIGYRRDHPRACGEKPGFPSKV